MTGDHPKRRPGMARAEAGGCVRAIGFDQGPGAIDRQAGVSAPADGGACAAPRGAGTDHRVSAHHRRRRRGAGARSPPSGDRRSPSHDIDNDRRFRLRALRPAGEAAENGDRHAARPARARAADAGHGARPPLSCSATPTASSPRPLRPAARSAPPDRRARADPAAHHPRRQRRRPGDHACRRRARLRHGADAEPPGTAR